MPIVGLDAKIVIKRSSTASEVPTVAPSDDHTDGTWSATDIYSGEFFVNEADDKVFIRIDDSIFELSLGASGSSNTIYSADDTIVDDREVTLDAHNLTFVEDGAGEVIIDGISRDGVLNINSDTDALSSFISFSSEGVEEASIGWDDSLDEFQICEGAFGSSQWFRYRDSADTLAISKDTVIGQITFASPARMKIRGRTTNTTDKIVHLEDLTGNERLSVLDNGTIEGRSGNSLSSSNAIRLRNSPGQVIIQATNDRRFGIRRVGGATVVFNCEGMTSDNTSTIADFTAASTVTRVKILGDGLMKFRNGPTSGEWGDAYNISSQSEATIDDTIASVVFDHDHSPTVNGTSSSCSGWFRSLKNTNFTSNETCGIKTFGRNTATGNITSLLGSYHEARSQANASITNMFCERTNFIHQNGTTTRGGGIWVDFDTVNGGTITNLYGIYIDRISNTGATITTSYGVYISQNDEGTTNYGIYQDGATAINYFESPVSIGSVDTPNSVAMLQIDSTTKGIVLTPMTAAQASLITPVEGLELNVSDTNGTFTSIGKWQYIGAAWVKL